jgi:ubiquinone/menaquinone biosynthesis C-methylase UbiE
MSADNSRGRDKGGLPPEIAARVYDKIGRLQDTQSPFERPALDRLITTGRFDAATSVFELGCGTGSMAHRLLSDHLPPQSTYRGVDVSSRMVTLASARIAPFADRASVTHTDGRLPLPAADHSADRFVAAYVLDLLPHQYATRVIDEAHRLLVPGGLACLASLSHGRSTVSRLVSRSWQRIWRLSPRLVGGCRPIDLRRLLDPDSWEVNEDVVIESWGVPSQVVVAAARSGPSTHSSH